VCEVVGTRHLLDDARFTSPTLRATHQVELAELLQPAFREDTVANWLRRFAEAGVPNAPINGFEQALSDPQAAHLELIQPLTLPNGHQTRTVACPVWLDG